MRHERQRWLPRLQGPLAHPGGSVQQEAAPRTVDTRYFLICDASPVSSLTASFSCRDAKRGGAVYDRCRSAPTPPTRGRHAS
jgi:hypothetical protein